MTSNSISVLSEKAARNKLVPFLGAGSSYGHLSLDWDAISEEMANEIGSKAKSNLDIAEEYFLAKGYNGLCEFLKKKLIVNEYNEDLDIVPLIVISLGIGLIYTTNQDNVFEKCIEKYGRKFRVVSKLEDLSNYLPGESIYVKYHGDLSIPDSIIFTKSSYKNRIDNQNHFLNIRMRSDILAKSFLFIGYSFRDPNVCLIFEEINNAFGGKIPPSYLVAFDYTPDLEILNDKYGINIINPLEEITGCKNTVEAFEKYMIRLCDETCSKKTGREINSLFRPAVPNATKVVSKYEISGVENSAKKSTIEEALSLFRATFDTSIIPEKYHERVAIVLLELCKKCSSRGQSDKLSAAIFNLKINMKNAIEALSSVLTTALYRGHSGGLDIFHPIIPGLDEAVYPFATARAIELIKDWGIPLNDAFRCHVTDWIRGYNELPDSVQQYIKVQINWAWLEKTTYENPISYWKRLGHKTPFGKRETFHSIYKKLLEMFPKGFSKPYED
jgi:hypothetical protein